MAKFYGMGNYTAKAFQGFIKDPGQDRSKAVEAVANSLGAKVHGFDLLRGPYDFVVIMEGTFTQMAAAKLAVEATGAISNFTISEAIDLNAAAKEAGKVAAAYKPAG
jgi:uncharacterized protein with GYD domain